MHLSTFGPKTLPNAHKPINNTSFELPSKENLSRTSGEGKIEGMVKAKRKSVLFIALFQSATKTKVSQK
jgi:hypothetical protein